jgi:hypothetical protein
LRSWFFDRSVDLWSATLGRNVSVRAPLFVVGAPRSGTTHFAELLARHPDLGNVSEAQSLWDPNYLDPEGDHAIRVEHATAAQVRRIRRRFAFALARSGRPRLLHKNPRSSVRIDFARHVFPDARFVHLIRDGRAVTRSILQKIDDEPFRQTAPFGHFCKPEGWRDWRHAPPVERTVWQWRRIVETILEKRDELGDRYLELRYEDLARPREAISRVWAFADLRVDAHTLSALPETATLPARNDVRTPVEANIDRVVAHDAGDLLKSLGYL